MFVDIGDGTVQLHAVCMAAGPQLNSPLLEGINF